MPMRKRLELSISIDLCVNVPLQLGSVMLYGLFCSVEWDRNVRRNEWVLEEEYNLESLLRVIKPKVVDDLLRFDCFDKYKLWYYKCSYV